MAQPDSVTVEVEFTAGVWTDVTTYADWSTAGQTRFGRTSPFSPAGPGNLSLTLANDDGRFTPGRQVLADGTTTHPYYPNVVPRKRIRVAYVISGTPYYRFTGYIKGWPPSMVGGTTPRVMITATTRDDRLSRVTFQPAHIQAMIFDAAACIFPLTESLGATSGSDIMSVAGPLTVTDDPGGSHAFGGNAPPLNEGTGLSVTNGTWQFDLPRGVIPADSWTIESWCGAPKGGGPLVLLPEATDGTSTISSWVDAKGGLGQFIYSDPLNGAGLAITFPSSTDDGQQHHYVLRGNDTGATLTITAYVDGVAAASHSYTSGGNTWSTKGATISPNATVANVQNYGPVAVYGFALSATRILRHAALGGLQDMTTDERIAEYLSWAGVATADQTLDIGVAVLASHPTNGKDVVTACQEMAVTEGGGSVFYIGADGKAQFRNRKARNPAAPTLTLDAEADLDGQTFQPVYDDTQIVNQVQGTRATASGTVATAIVNDAASQTAYGLTSASFTSYTNVNKDTTHNAEDQLAQQRQPGYRLGQVAVDLTTAQTAGLYAAVAATDIGDRIRVTNLPPGAAPATQVDVIVEGWADTFSDAGYTVVFDTSPADNPARGIFDDATYGRFQCDGNTLNAALTNSATTVVIATAAGKATFTTAAVYPLTIQVGAEHIRLNSAPGGSSSPQTFTGVTRGVDGTTTAAQASAAVVTISPRVTYTL